MQQLCLFALYFLAFASASEVGRHFGPSSCVSLDRTVAGSCRFQTKCQGLNIDTVEFAFDCYDDQGGIIRHSFGKGGFDAEETFDTELKCAKCELPMKAAFKPKRSYDPPAQPVVLAGAGAEPAVAGEGKAVNYGPNSCVSTWRENKHGHCMMRTMCNGVDTSGYDFGLVCVDAQGKPTRHLFGRDSFDSVELFDTLIPCKSCLALDDAKVGEAVLGGDLKQVEELVTEVKGMTAQVANLSTDIKKLNDKVFGNASATPAATAAATTTAAPAATATSVAAAAATTAAAPTAAAAAATTAAPATLLHRGRHVRKHRLHRHHHAALQHRRSAHLRHKRHHHGSHHEKKVVHKRAHHKKARRTVKKTHQETKPVVEEQAAPVVEEQAAPVVEEQAAPVVEEQAAPVVEEQDDSQDSTQVLAASSQDDEAVEAGTEVEQETSEETASRLRDEADPWHPRDAPEAPEDIE